MSETIAQTHEGGCLCGAVRYRARNQPVRTSACHCTFCQRRTGSAFGVGAYFKQEDVEVLRGALTTYEHRSDETQRWLRIQFCPHCGTTVTWTVEAMPGMRALGLGTFDDPKWLKVERFGWFRSAHPWVIAPAGVEVFEKSSLR
ncbi:MAG: GFA family protein [Pseudomonadota bacterium]|nr:GFA family protein [Pseudomonadota bacterium]